MPLSLVLIIVGIICIVVAYYVFTPGPTPLYRLFMALGVAALAIGVVILVYGLLTGSSGLKVA